MIVLDGRTDAEKLGELLTETEQTHLDFKEMVDLRVKKDELNLIKDIVTMSNRPGGGYILIGVSDDGVPCCTAGTIPRRDFDGANIGQKVRVFVESDVQVITAIHEVDGNEVVVIHAQPHSDGLPVPMAKLGQYQDAGGKPRVVFRPGDLFVREGSANVQIRHCHWRDVLSHHAQLIRERAMADAQTLIGEFVKQIQSGAGTGDRAPTGAAPMLLDMDEETLADAVVTNFEAGKEIRIRRFLAQARNAVAGAVTAGEDIGPVLDRIAVVAAQAAMYERLHEARLAIETLHTIYTELNGDQRQVGHLVDVLIRVYVIGGLAVRMRQWPLVHNIVQRPVQSSPGGGYVYVSWLRHGQVEGSRVNLFPKEKGGMLISSARELAAEHPALRPDVTEAGVLDFAKLEHNDILLNSLCQFDLAYCLVVTAEGKGNSKGYPSCAAFYQYRANPVLEIVATDQQVRETIFPESDDAQVATAMVDVMTRAEKESFNYGGSWDGLPPAAVKFATAALP